jgi:hypothetical protein
MSAGATKYQPDRDCKQVAGQGNCLIAAIDRSLADLGTGGERQPEGLRFLSHFVSGLHQLYHRGAGAGWQWYPPTRRPASAYTLLEGSITFEVRTQSLATASIHLQPEPFRDIAEPRKAYRTGLALAEWLCRTADRIDPA